MTTTTAQGETPAGKPLPPPEAPGAPSHAPKAAPPSGHVGAPGPAEGAKRARGQRGPDKRPRQRKARARSEADPTVKPAAGSSPFSDPVAGEGRDEKKRGKAPPNVLSALPPEDVAKLLYEVGGVVLVSVASMRYGAAAQGLAFTPDERGTLEPLTAAWLKEQTLALTTGEALALALCMILGQKVAVLELGRMQERAANVPASAAIVDVNAPPSKPA